MNHAFSCLTKLHIDSVKRIAEPSEGRELLGDEGSREVQRTQTNGVRQGSGRVQALRSGLGPKDICKRTGISRASVYRILNADPEHAEEMKDRLSNWGGA